MSLKIYAYEKCGTCRKALNWLDTHGVLYEVVPIRETPPTIKELQKMLESVDGNLRKLFNTSGNDYKSLNMKERLPSLEVKEALKVLNQNGNLVKRPFVVGDDVCLIGFNEDAWKEILNA